MMVSGGEMRGFDEAFPAGGAPRRRLDSNELLPLVYEELRKLARAQMREERVGHTLQATALVHEAVVRLQASGFAWESELHFLRVAGRCMMRILKDYADARGTLKRGGGRKRDFNEIGSLSELCADLDADAIRSLAVSLDRFGEEHPRAHDVVLLRFIHEVPVAKVAGLLDMSQRSIQRDWDFARAWLARAMAGHLS